jgi:hypothetical protein
MEHLNTVEGRIEAAKKAKSNLFESLSLSIPDRKNEAPAELKAFYWEPLRHLS